MLKKTLFLICMTVGLGAATITAQDKFMADKVVAVVGNSAILYSEIVELGNQILQERRAENYTLDRDSKHEALEHLMLQKLLYNQALIDSVSVQLDNVAMMVNDHVDNMVKEKGSVAALEAFFKKPIFEIKDDIRTRYEEGQYARAMQNEIKSKVKITPGEAERYFKRKDKDSLPIIPEQYVFSQITKFPASLQEAKQRTRERLLEMRERVLKGEKFAMLARLYSVDPGSAMRGGEMEPSPKETFVGPFANALEKLKPGQVSEVVETEYGFHIIELIGKKDKLYHMRHILLKPAFTDTELDATIITLDSIVRIVRADSLSFEKAAAKHSDDKFSRFNGGIASNIDMLEQYGDPSMASTKFMKETLGPEDFKALSKLKIGEISNAFMSQDKNGNILGKVVMLKEIIPAHPASLKEDYLQLEELALLDKQDREFNTWLNKKIASMYIRIEPEYKTDDFENKAWLK